VCVCGVVDRRCCIASGVTVAEQDGKIGMRIDLSCRDILCRYMNLRKTDELHGYDRTDLYTTHPCNKDTILTHLVSFSSLPMDDRRRIYQSRT